MSRCRCHRGQREAFLLVRRRVPFDSPGAFWRRSRHTWMRSRTGRKSRVAKRWVDGYLIEVDAATSVRMSRIRQRDTRPELVVRRWLHAHRVRYRVNNRDLPGSPDVANRRKRWAVFVHGCYWHRHPGCRRTTTPRRNREFWLKKFEANEVRDRSVQRELEKMGYRVFVVWECETLVPSVIEARLGDLAV